VLAATMEGACWVVRVGHEAWVLSEKRVTLVALAIGLMDCP
jgi:hypothetical protein